MNIRATHHVTRQTSAAIVSQPSCHERIGVRVASVAAFAAVLLVGVPVASADSCRNAPLPSGCSRQSARVSRYKLVSPGFKAGQIPFLISSFEVSGQRCCSAASEHLATPKTIELPASSGMVGVAHEPPAPRAVFESGPSYPSWSSMPMREDADSPNRAGGTRPDRKQSYLREANRPFRTRGAQFRLLRQ